eukprot:6473018-Amphidinium_carterae.1
MEEILTEFTRAAQHLVHAAELQRTATKELTAQVGQAKKDSIPDLLKVLPKFLDGQKFVNEVKSRFSALVNAQTVLEKNKVHYTAGTIPPQFKHKVAAKLPQFYLLEAQRTDHPVDQISPDDDDEVLADASDLVDFERTLKKLVSDQQWELFTYVYKHQEKVLELAKQRVSHGALSQLVADHVGEHLRHLTDTPAPEIVRRGEAAKLTLTQIFQLIKEEAQYNMHSRMEKDKAKKEAREHALQDAAAKFESLPGHVLLGLLSASSPASSSTSRTE